MKTKLLLLATTVIVLLTAPLPAAEPTPLRAPGLIRDAEVLLNETELRVLTQQYEKTLTQFYDAQMALSLLENSILPEPPRPTDLRPSAEAQAEAMSKRIKVLAEWSENLRRRIESKAAELNKREEQIARQHNQRSTEATAIPLPSKKVPSTTRSEDAPRPEL